MTDFQWMMTARACSAAHVQAVRWPVAPCHMMPDLFTPHRRPVYNYNKFCVHLPSRMFCVLVNCVRVAQVAQAFALLTPSQVQKQQGMPARRATSSHKDDGPNFSMDVFSTEKCGTRAVQGPSSEIPEVCRGPAAGCAPLGRKPRHQQHDTEAQQSCLQSQRC